MAFMSRFSRSRSSSRSPSRREAGAERSSTPSPSRREAGAERSSTLSPSRREAGAQRSSTPSPSRREAAAARERVSTLSVAELERLLYTGKTACNHADQVWPRLYIGDQEMAADRRELIKLGITHILNCAQSKWRGGAEYYAGMNITYQGIEAHDSPTFDMSVNFYPAAEFIHRALSSGGTVLVHCAVGVSRSATLVLAYLMICQSLTLVEAIKTVKGHRGVIPNRGFLRQLNGLDAVLRDSRKTSP